MDPGAAQRLDTLLSLLQSRIVDLEKGLLDKSHELNSIRLSHYARPELLLDSATVPRSALVPTPCPSSSVTATKNSSKYNPDLGPFSSSPLNGSTSSMEICGSDRRSASTKDPSAQIEKLPSSLDGAGATAPQFRRYVDNVLQILPRKYTVYAHELINDPSSTGISENDVFSEFQKHFRRGATLDFHSKLLGHGVGFPVPVSEAKDYYSAQKSWIPLGVWYRPYILIRVCNPPFSPTHQHVWTALSKGVTETEPLQLCIVSGIECMGRETNTDLLGNHDLTPIDDRLFYVALRWALVHLS